MAKITQAEITGLAGRSGTLSIDFNEDLNVFWGLNGSGKTSLLKILHSAMSGDPSILMRVPFKAAKVTFRLARGQTYTRSIKKPVEKINRRELEILKDLDMDDEAAEELMLRELRRSWEWRTSPDTQRKYFGHGYLPISRMSDLARSRHHLHSPSRREFTGLLNEAQIDEEFARQTLVLWREYSNQALMDIRRAQSEGLAEVLSIVLAGEQPKKKPKSSLSSADAYTLVKNFLQSQRIAPSLGSVNNFSAHYEDSPVLREVVARIEEVEKSIRLAQEPQRRLVDLLSSLFTQNKKIVLDARSISVQIGKEELPIESLSSGEKQIVRLLMECLAVGGNCILIDEPELSLHVDWQHRLIESMRLVNGDAQIVLATHSPEVMAEIPDVKVFEL